MKEITEDSTDISMTLPQDRIILDNKYPLHKHIYLSSYRCRSCHQRAMMLHGGPLQDQLKFYIKIEVTNTYAFYLLVATLLQKQN